MRSMQLAAVLAALSAAGAQVVVTSDRRAPEPTPEPRPRPKPNPEDTTRRYCGMTDEQRAWNEAIDRKKAMRNSLAAKETAQ